MSTIRSSISPLAFFVLTFVLSWLIWVPLVLSHFGLGPFAIPEGVSSLVRLLGVLMPAMSALILTARAVGTTGVRQLLGGLARWRVAWVWWGAAVLAQPAILVATSLVYNALGGQPPVSPLPPTPLVAVIVSGLMLTLATLGEEIGWRGLALPALQQRHSPLMASLVLAMLWATWHVPFWLLLDSFTSFGWGYLGLNYLFVFPLTIYITWFYNHSRGSLLLPVGFHLAFNLVNVVWLPVTSNPAAFGALVAAEWLIGALVMLRLEPRPRPSPALTTP